MSQEKYIGMDVHQATISVAVMDAQGKLIMECLRETKAATIVEFVRGLQGRLSLTFEEGTSAAWLHDLLKPNVDRLVIGDPRKNALLKDGNKSDQIDARVIGVAHDCRPWFQKTSLMARRWFHGGRPGDCKTAAACLGFGVGQQRRPHSPAPDHIARCGHVQIVRIKEIFWFAILEHRRDHVDVVQIGTFASAGAYRIVDLALKRKLRKAQF
jgi:hypothetical protein